MKDIYEKNKITIWIGILTIIILIVGLVIFFKKDEKEDNVQIAYKDEYNLILFGSDMEIYQYEKYQEPGFYAILNNDIVTEQVTVDNPLDNSKIGTYEITYKYRTITKTRTVKVIPNPDSNKSEFNNSTTIKDENIELKLIGEEEITIKLNGEYQELGAKAYDSNGNDISSDIKILGTINTNQEGTYTIKYSITRNGITKSLERKVNVVKNTSLSVTTSNQENYTNKDITINVVAMGSNFSYMKLPDNTVTRDSKKTYVVSENGTYTFEAHDVDNTVETQSITIKNIDKIKPSGTCTATVANSKTTIKISATDNVGIDHYTYNGSNKGNTNSFVVNSILKSAKIEVYDKAGNSNTISCSVINNTSSSTTPTTPATQVVDDGNLEIHFMVSGHDDDAILIRNNKYTIMIDGGRYEDKKNVVPYLQDLGIKKIDALIGSHVHYNHVQAQAAIIDIATVSHAYYSVDIFDCLKLKQCKGSGEKQDNKYIADKLKQKNIPTTILKSGDYLEFGEMKLYFIGPNVKKLTTHENANSFIFILKYRNTSYMFTGDAPSKSMDAATLQSVASKWNLSIDIDVLKWPHHGYNQLSDTFFKATTPKYAYIPSGGCSSQYPSSNDKSLMKKYGTTYYSRCEKNVVLISDGKNIDIKTNQKASDYKR